LAIGPAVAVAVVIVAVLVPVVPPPRLLARPLGPARRFARRFGQGHRRRRAVDDLVEFAPVEPDTPAFRAIVDLHPLPVHHLKFGSIHRALHRRLSDRKSTRLNSSHVKISYAV